MSVVEDDEDLQNALRQIEEMEKKERENETEEQLSLRLIMSLSREDYEIPMGMEDPKAHSANPAAISSPIREQESSSQHRPNNFDISNDMKKYEGIPSASPAPYFPSSNPPLPPTSYSSNIKEKMIELSLVDDDDENNNIHDEDIYQLALKLEEEDRRANEERMREDERLSMQLIEEEERERLSKQSEIEQLNLLFIKQLEEQEAEEERQFMLSEELAKRIYQEWLQDEQAAQAELERKRQEKLQNEAKSSNQPQEEEQEEEEEKGNCYVCQDNDDSNQEDPLLSLKCRHPIHLTCAIGQLESSKNDPGKPIRVSHAQCGICRRWLEHEQLNARVAPFIQLHEQVLEIAKQRWAIEEDAQAQKTAPPPELLAKMVFFSCYLCKKPYYGGRVECGAADADVDADPKELVCPLCANKDATNESVCSVHGKEYIQFKCRWCCTPANFFCFGTTHFCFECHKTPRSCPVKPCRGPPTCSINHPPNDGKTEWCLGCGLCRELKSHGDQLPSVPDLPPLPTPATRGAPPARGVVRGVDRGAVRGVRGGRINPSPPVLPRASPAPASVRGGGRGRPPAPAPVLPRASPAPAAIRGAPPVNRGSAPPKSRISFIFSNLFKSNPQPQQQ